MGNTKYSSKAYSPSNSFNTTALRSTLFSSSKADASNPYIPRKWWRGHVCGVSVDTGTSLAMLRPRVPQCVLEYRGHHMPLLSTVSSQASV